MMFAVEIVCPQHPQAKQQECVTKIPDPLGQDRKEASKQHLAASSNEQQVGGPEERSHHL
jgi:hypothetical protein